jgi:poly(hydroxyalkanoate) granule-associated protein
MAKARARALSHSPLPKLIEENLDLLSDTVSKFQRDAERIQKRLVQRGKKVEREGVKRVNRILKDLRRNGVSGRVRTAQRQVEKRVDASVTQVFKALNLPQRKDVEALSRKVSALEKQVGTLRRARQRTAVDRVPKATI